MKKIWLFSLTILVHMVVPMSEGQWRAHMQKKITTQTRIVDSVTNALKAFDINPQSIEIETDHTSRHSDSWSKWAAGSSRIRVNAGMASDPHLLEFVSYCAAAEIKRHTETKRDIAVLATLGGPTVVGNLLIPLALPQEYQLCSVAAGGAACTSLAGSLAGIAITYFAGDYIMRFLLNKIEKQAYSLACKKLIDEKIGAIGAYLAYISSHDRESKYSHKFEAIKNTLEEAGYAFKTEVDNNQGKKRAQVTILNLSTSQKLISEISWLEGDKTDADESFTLQTKIEEPHAKRH